MKSRRTARNSLRGGLVVLALAAAMVAVGPPSPALAVAGGVAAAPPVHCVGSGTDGNRVQMVYAYNAGTPNRFAEREATIRLAAWVAQQNINDSARREGAQRWLRFVSSATGCQVTILTVQMPAGSDSSDANFVNWRTTMQAAGLNASNRIYAVIHENSGAGCAYTDNSGLFDTTPGTANAHNTQTAWETFAPFCFGGQSMAHETAHALGAMQPGMPHADAGLYHCTDGIESLCGADAPTVVCADPLDARRYDCNRDDYFAINPQGAWLPTHWNVAKDSLYLDAGTATTVVSVPQPLPPQLLHALDVEGGSIAFSWAPTVQPQGSGYTLQYELLRNATVVATTAAAQPYARVTGLAHNTTASYTVRTRFTDSLGSVRTSAASTALSVTTNNTSATAGGAEDGATMIIANDLTDGSGRSLVMDLYSFNPNDNAVIKQWDVTYAINQQWKMTAATGGTFTLTNQSSSKCLSPLGGATAVGTAIVQVTCNGAAAQRWTFTAITGATYQVKTSAGTCVGSSGNSPNDGTDLVLATCSTSQPSQRWTTNRVA